MRSTRSKFLEDWKRRESLEPQRREGSSSDLFLGAPARVVARLDAKALRGNYLAVRELAQGQALLPMVKADAYGHGAAWASRLCLDLPDLYGLGVATLSEGAELREELGKAGGRVSIIVFSGACPWTGEKGAFCEKFGLTPVIASEEDFRSFVSGGWTGRIPYELKFNTGMNRLGIPAASSGQVARALKKLGAEAQPQGIFMHLAMAEEPAARLSRLQVERFIALRRELAPIAPAAQFHLANSAGIWNQKLYGLDGLTDVVRPGLSLYGVPPWEGAPARGISPVLSLEASVLAVHRLKPGESTGYGARFKVTEGVSHVAIVGAGYADGIHRSLSGNEKGPGGHLWLGDQAQRVLGTVSMDLCAVSCAPETRVGDWAEFIGPHVDAWAQARAAGTIPYELLTSVSARVQRIYG